MFQQNKLQYHLGQLYVKYSWPIWFPKFRHQKDRPHQNKGGDNSWILDQIDLRELDTWSVDQQQAAKKLLCDYSEPFSKNDLDLGKCNILKYNIKLTDNQPFKERYKSIPTHLFEEVNQHLQEMVEMGASRRHFSPWALCSGPCEEKGWGP